MQPISELHKAARRYAEAGIPVFPVEVNGKKPVTANGFYDATTDLAQIDKWWSSADYNLAFSPGENNLFVIDLDPGYCLPENLPETYTVRTPRQGFHFYFSGNGPTTANKLGAHVDTRGIGGYVLAPPSVIHGCEYRVEINTDYAELPAWVSEALQKSDTKIASSTSEKDLPINIERAKGVLTKYVDDDKVAVEGQGGDDLTYRICCEILDFGLTPETALQLLCEIWNDHCRPPWPSDDLAAKLQNADSYRQNEVGAYALEPTEKVFGHILAKLYPVKRSRFYFKSEEEQDDEPEPQWIIRDLISERSTVLMFGPTQSYKSFIALELALSIATGQCSFGASTLPGKVFYCALEGRAHLKKARRAWRLARGIEGRITNFLLGTAPLVGIPGEIEEYCDEIQKRCGQAGSPKVIIVDTLGKSMAGLNENDARDAGLFIRFCDSMVERFGCTIIAIHHSGKDTAKGARGSSAFHAGFDTVIEVSAQRETKAVSVKVQKHKDAEERETPWTFEGRLIGGSLAFFPTDAKEHFKLTHEQDEYSPKKIGAALQKLSAYGEDKAVTTNVLASQLAPRGENQSESDFQIVLARTARALHKAGKDRLEAYTATKARQTLWLLPHPN